MQTDSSSSVQTDHLTECLPESQGIRKLTTDSPGHPHRYPNNTYGFRDAQAIIVNFKDYHPTVREKLRVRDGSEDDVALLKETFESMGCIDLEEPWVTNDKLNDFLVNLREFADNDFEDYDCFILVVMAHGDKNGIIYGLHGETIHIEDIWGLFTADKCRSLANKPKLFFFQACRGEELSKGVHADDESPTPETYESDKLSIPVQADILLVFSTFEGKSSLRGEYGSPFIQDLCTVLSEDNAKEWKLREPILTLMTYVCHDTSSRTFIDDLDTIRTPVYECDEADLLKQMPTVLSTLRKLFYFRESPP